MKKIIFICKHNVFRSRIAEEYFKKTNKNKNVRVISRGIIMGGHSDEDQRGIPKAILGVDIAKRSPRPLTIPELREASMIFVVADDIPKVIFEYQRNPIKAKVVVWEVPDEQRKDRAKIKKITLKIKKKVDELNKQLEKKK